MLQNACTPPSPAPQPTRPHALRNPGLHGWMDGWTDGCSLRAGQMDGWMVGWLVVPPVSTDKPPGGEITLKPPGDLSLFVRLAGHPSFISKHCTVLRRRSDKNKQAAEDICFRPPASQHECRSRDTGGRSSATLGLTWSDPLIVRSGDSGRGGGVLRYNIQGPNGRPCKTSSRADRHTHTHSQREGRGYVSVEGCGCVRVWVSGTSSHSLIHRLASPTSSQVV